MIVDICLYFQVYFANKAKEATSLIYLQITFDINSHHWKSNDKVEGPQRNSQSRPPYAAPMRLFPYNEFSQRNIVVLVCTESHALAVK